MGYGRARVAMGDGRACVAFRVGQHGDWRGRTDAAERRGHWPIGRRVPVWGILVLVRARMRDLRSVPGALREDGTIVILGERVELLAHIMVDTCIAVPDLSGDGCDDAEMCAWSRQTRASGSIVQTPARPA